MRLFLANVILALIWGASSGSLTALNLLFGFGVGFGVLYASRRVMAPSAYFGRVGYATTFLLFFILEMLRASVRVARDVMTPTHYSRPGIVAYPIHGLSDMELTLLAKLISLTPGTLTIDVADDRSALYIHAMFIEDPEDLRREIRDGLERKLLQVLR